MSDVGLRRCAPQPNLRADWREVLGQLPRIVAELLFSRLWVPLGKTGRARLSAFRPMPISDELQRLLE